MPVPYGIITIAALCQPFTARDEQMIQIYGTIGPACASVDTLKAMFAEGMTGIRLNTSHVSLREAEKQIEMIHTAAAACGIRAELLIDMQGPELRLGKLNTPVDLTAGSSISLDTLPVPQEVRTVLTKGMEILLDDGRLLLEMTDDANAVVERGGTLKSGKSIAVPGAQICLPAMTVQDRQNIRDAGKYGVTGVMQPFVRSAEDLSAVRQALHEAGGESIRLLAKIEDLSGVSQLESFFPLADEIVIARGDLGNAMPLWELPRVQKDIESRCRKAGMPFMVVTQMLASMEHSAVPTRAEVSDIYNAVCDGASSVMVTGETAVGAYPVEVIRYLARTVQSYSEQVDNGDT